MSSLYKLRGLVGRQRELRKVLWRAYVQASEARSGRASLGLLRGSGAVSAAVGGSEQGDDEEEDGEEADGDEGEAAAASAGAARVPASPGSATKLLSRLLPAACAADDQQRTLGMRIAKRAATSLAYDGKLAAHLLCRHLDC